MHPRSDKTRLHRRHIPVYLVIKPLRLPVTEKPRNLPSENIIKPSCGRIRHINTLLFCYRIFPEAHFEIVQKSYRKYTHIHDGKEFSLYPAYDLILIKSVIMLLQYMETPGIRRGLPRRSVESALAGRV